MLFGKIKHLYSANMVIFSDIEMRGYLFAVRALLSSVRRVEADEPSVGKFFERLADLLQHLERAEEISLPQYEDWKAMLRLRSEQCSETIKNIPKDTMRGAARRIIAPELPRFKAFLMEAEPAVICGYLTEAVGKHLIEQSVRYNEWLARIRFGTETVHLLRKLLARVTSGDKAKALKLVQGAKRDLESAPKYDEFLGMLVQEDVDTAWSESRIAELAVRTVGSLYEHRGKVVTNLLWGIMNLLGWVKLEPPSNAHEIISKKLLAHRVGETLGAFTSDWRHWRNAASHGKMITRLATDSGLYLLIRDENMKGQETYREVVSAAEACAEAGDAVDYLHLNSAYVGAIGLIENELMFDVFLNPVDLLGLCVEILSMLRDFVNVMESGD